MGKYGKMGRLKPDATYIYERVDGVTYAREFGSTDRFEIGREYKVDMQNQVNWHDLINTAKTNPTLQSALDECIMIYKLSKEYKDGI